jgi:hypothetical protein
VATVAQVVTFGCEQLVGQVYRVFKLTRYMLPVDGRGHKVPLCMLTHQCCSLHKQRPRCATAA